MPRSTGQINVVQAITYSCNYFFYYFGDELGIDKATGKTIVKVNKDFFRPAEVQLLLGNPAKAEEKLGWKREISFAELVQRMVDNDMALVEKELKVAAL